MRPAEAGQRGEEAGAASVRRSQARNLGRMLCSPMRSNGEKMQELGRSLGFSAFRSPRGVGVALQIGPRFREVMANRSFGNFEMRCPYSLERGPPQLATYSKPSPFVPCVYLSQDPAEVA